MLIQTTGLGPSNTHHPLHVVYSCARRELILSFFVVKTSEFCTKVKLLPFGGANVARRSRGSQKINFDSHLYIEHQNMLLRCLRGILFFQAKLFANNVTTFAKLLLGSVIYKRDYHCWDYKTSWSIWNNIFELLIFSHLRIAARDITLMNKYSKLSDFPRKRKIKRRMFWTSQTSFRGSYNKDGNISRLGSGSGKRAIWSKMIAKFLSASTLRGWNPFSCNLQIPKRRLTFCASCSVLILMQFLPLLFSENKQRDEICYL